MADGLQFGEFKPNRAGIIEVTKSAAVQKWTRETGEKVASQANAAATARRAGIPAKIRGVTSHNDPDSFVEQPYGNHFKVGRYAPYSAVRADTREGAYDSNQHHTLDSFNH